MLSDIFKEFDQPNAPGASVVVLRGDEVIARSAFGMADLEQGRVCTPNTCFRLASVTKQLTAMAAMLLAERGKLSLHEPIGRLLPEVPAYAAVVTPHQLLTHTSGLVDYEDLIPAGQTAQVHDADIPTMLPVEMSEGQYTVSGLTYRYSNTGYVLLALLAERAAGRSFPELLRELIFEPLGMRSLAFVEGGPQIPERAYGYTWKDRHWARTDQSVTSATLGDGGVYASVEDMARWLAALQAGAIGSPETQAAIWSHWTRTDDGRLYGYGWFIGEHLNEPLITHDGTTTGFRTAVVRLPKRGLSAAVLTNRTHADPTALALEAVREAAGGL
jgi:CubicO group peptidase (beta-lactamase class C family)